MILTPVIISAYAERAVATSTAGFDRPNYRGASAPVLLGAFFVPEGFLYGDAHGETFGSAGGHGIRSVNLVCVVTTLIDSKWRRRLIIISVEAVMPKPLFRVDDSVTPSALADNIRYLSYQAGAVHDALTEFSSCKSSMQSQRGFEHHGWLLWALGSLLEQQRALCERLEEVGLSVPTGGGS